jgi:hypothetical protein
MSLALAACRHLPLLPSLAVPWLTLPLPGQVRYSLAVTLLRE